MTPGLKPVLRNAQTFLPFIRTAKFDTYNFLTRSFGLRLDPEFRFLERLPPARLAIDVGGNWGQSIHALKRTARAGKIISFEPNLVLADRLASKFASDASVQIENCGLAAEVGQFSLFVPRYRNFIYDGLASLDEAGARGWLNSKSVAGFDPALLHVDEQKVEVRRLDDFGLSPDVVKIDVEGREDAVLEGGLETFRRAQPVAIVENPSTAFVSQLALFGLKPYSYDGKRLHDDWRRQPNTLFLSDDHRAQAGL